MSRLLRGSIEGSPERSPLRRNIEKIFPLKVILRTCRDQSKRKQKNKRAESPQRAEKEEPEKEGAMAQTGEIKSDKEIAYEYTNMINTSITEMAWEMSPSVTAITVSNISAKTESNSAFATINNTLRHARTPVGNSADIPADIAERLAQVDAANAGAIAGE